MIFKEIDNIRDVGVICHYLPNPHQGRDVDVRLIKTILKDAGISREEWLSA